MTSYLRRCDARRINVSSTSHRPQFDVASTSLRRHCDVMCLRGKWGLIENKFLIEPPGHIPDLMWFFFFLMFCHNYQGNSSTSYNCMLDAWPRWRRVCFCQFSFVKYPLSLKFWGFLLSFNYILSDTSYLKLNFVWLSTFFIYHKHPFLSLLVFALS